MLRYGGLIVLSRRESLRGVISTMGGTDRDKKAEMASTLAEVYFLEITQFLCQA